MNGQLKAPLSLASYAAFALGLIIRKMSYKKLGTLLSLLGSVIVAVHRCILYIALRRRVRRNLKADLASIAHHYDMARLTVRSQPEHKYPLAPSGKSGFWLAEICKEGKNPEVVGCVGLGEDYLFHNLIRA